MVTTTGGPTATAAKILETLASLKKKVGPRRTEAELRDVEAALGFALPASYRTYVLEVGDGGPGLASEVKIPSILKLSAKTIARARKPFPLTQEWYSPDPDTVRICKQFGRYEAKKALFVPLPDGAEPTDGTIPLGVPTGTHEYYVLVLRGPHAGEVWIDATCEDTGGVVPLAEPDFLAASLAYFTTLALDKRLEGEADALVRSGRAGELLASASPGARRELGERISVIVHEALRDPNVSIATCLGIADSAAAVADASKDDPFGAASYRRIATLAYLMAVDYTRALASAEASRDAHGVPKDVHERFAPTTNLHHLFACAGLGRAAGKVKPPKRTADYRVAHLDVAQLVVAFGRLDEPGRAAVLEALPATWGNVLEGR